MKNYVQAGDLVTLTAPYAVVSGAGALVGSIFGVAATDIANAVDGEFKLTGVFDLGKTGSQAWTQGAKIYWDDTTKLCTTTASTNKLIGVAIAAAQAADTIGRVRLSSAFTI